MERVIACVLAGLAAVVPAPAGAQVCAEGTWWIAAEHIWVGSPYGECPDEAALPTKRVRVRAMCLDAAPVTVDAYGRCVADGHCPARSADPGCATEGRSAADCVTWEGARRYCTSRGMHLPTEAQLDRGLRALDERVDELGEWTATSADDDRPWLPRLRTGGSDERIVRWGYHDRGSSHRWDVAEPRIGFRCRSEPARATTTAAPTTWTAPRCFAYSRADDAFACFDFSLSTDDMGSGDFAPMDFERWTPPPADVAWGGHKAIALVGAGDPRRIEIASRDYFGSSPITRVRSAAAAVRLARSRGFREPVTRSVELPNGRWTRLGSAWLRFDSRLHVGGASEAFVGSLQLACEDPASSSPPTRELIDDRRAESAWVFAADASPSIVVGLMRQGGGEGSGYFRTRYLRVDGDACPP